MTEQSFNLEYDVCCSSLSEPSPMTTLRELIRRVTGFFFFFNLLQWVVVDVVLVHWLRFVASFVVVVAVVVHLVVH